MPWKVVKDTSACPVGKPWAVKNVQTGTVNGRCHATKAKAEDQAKAMYASENKQGKKVKMEEYPQIVKALTGTPWLILPESLHTIIGIVNSKLEGKAYSEEEITARLEAAKNNNDAENPRLQIGGGVGIISLHGPVFPRANLMTRLSGATSLEMFGSDLQELLADDSVKQIVMDINSPGGSSDLVHETGTMIRQAREQKPIYAVANTAACSAALWLMSQATKAYATPSGKVGSLGVLTVHEDQSAADAQSGRKVTVIHAGDYKTALSPHAPLSEEGRQYLQEAVDEMKVDFVNEVATGRGLDPSYVEQTFGNAKIFSAKKAAEINMVDGVMSMNDLLGDLVTQNALDAGGQVTSQLQQHLSRIGEKGGELILDGSTLGNIIDSTNNLGGELALKPEQLAELKAALGVSEDTDDDKFVEAAKVVFTEHAELQNNLNVVDAEKQFAQQNPAMYAEHQRLLEKDRINEAKAFTDSISAVKSVDGSDTHTGLSALAIETVTDAHKKFAEGKGSLADFETAITTIMNGGMVKFGEEGSSRPKEITAIDTSTKSGLQAARLQFAAKVNEVRAEYSEKHDGNQMEYMEAVKLAAQREPELAAAYQLSATN